jgi:hypothetical protein
MHTPKIPGSHDGSEGLAQSFNTGTPESTDTAPDVVNQTTHSEKAMQELVRLISDDLTASLPAGHREDAPSITVSYRLRQGTNPWIRGKVFIEVSAPYPCEDGSPYTPVILRWHQDFLVSSSKDPSGSFKDCADEWRYQAIRRLLSASPQALRSSEKMEISARTEAQTHAFPSGMHSWPPITERIDTVEFLRYELTMSRKELLPAGVFLVKGLGYGESRLHGFARETYYQGYFEVHGLVRVNADTGDWIENELDWGSEPLSPPLDSLGPRQDLSGVVDGPEDVSF